MSIETQDIEYAVRDGISLLARMHKPTGPGPFPLVIELHGGTWMTGDRHTDALLNDALAPGSVKAATDTKAAKDRKAATAAKSSKPAKTTKDEKSSKPAKDATPKQPVTAA